MLYPEFDDLLSYRRIAGALTHPSCRQVKSSLTGQYRSAFRGQGIEFDSVREYVPGDDIRNIDWRVTARTGSAHLKLFREEKERQVLLALDVNAKMRFGTRSTFKSVQAARVASLLGWSALDKQDRLSACLYGDVEGGIRYYPSKRTKQPFCQMLKTLTASPKEEHEVSLADVCSYLLSITHAGALVYLISDFMELDRTFTQTSSLGLLAKKCTVVLVSINDPSDRTIPPIGRLNISDRKGLMHSIATDSDKGRRAYEEKWNEHLEKLEELKNSYRLSLIELSTESEISRDLMSAFKKMRKGKGL